MEEKTKNDIILTGEIILWVLFAFTILGVIVGIAYLSIMVHWTFGFLIIPLMTGLTYLLISKLGITEIGEC